MLLFGNRKIKIKQALSFRQDKGYSCPKSVPLQAIIVHILGSHHYAESSLDYSLNPIIGVQLAVKQLSKRKVESVDRK